MSALDNDIKNNGYKIALSLRTSLPMTDEWIAGNNYSEDTVSNMRDDILQLIKFSASLAAENAILKEHNSGLVDACKAAVKVLNLDKFAWTLGFIEGKLASYGKDYERD